MSLKIRPYAPADRQAVRDICCDTGFMGKPIDPVYVDRDAFADFFTRYYTDLEPENAIVAESDGKVVGYLLGCLKMKGQGWRQLKIILFFTVPKIIARVLLFRYNIASFKFLSWFLFKAASQTPKPIEGAAHFHVNMITEFRTGIAGRRLIFPYMRKVMDAGIKGIFGQMQVYEDRRSEKAFERYGFQFTDRKEVTKFKDYYDKQVWVATIYNDFSVSNKSNWYKDDAK